jgi:hypothetical protein
MAVGVVHGDDDLAVGHTPANHFGIHTFSHSDLFHWRRDMSLYRELYLGLCHVLFSFWQPAGKKKPKPIISAWGFTISAKNMFRMSSAGLLTRGSSYWPRLPTTYRKQSVVAVANAVFVLTHSGGSVPELHRLPFSALIGATESPNLGCI